MSNLPSWAGADAAYSKAYAILAKLARAGHVTPATGYWKGGRWIQWVPGSVSQEMRDAIDALNKGDENEIKAFNLRHLELLIVDVPPKPMMIRLDRNLG